MIKVEIANKQSEHVFDAKLLQAAVRRVLDGESIEEADVSVAIVDDATIHVLNRKYLQHDYATDVLSFLLSSSGDLLEGEIIVSADTAAREAIRFRSSLLDELLLYLIHGTLHLAGYDDASDSERATMRVKERQYLGALGRPPNYEERTATIVTAPGAKHPAEGETRS
ncbi:MAG: rRNA maturation RNase YbeY [Planctomycetota bacterium]|nr:rRNA maturation RNase YbeY [Planctomycetota bacterium]